MVNILAVAEQYWPEGGGGALATHQIVDLLSKEAEETVLSGTKNPAEVNDVKYLFVPMLRVPNKLRLWAQLTFLARKSWFIKLLRSADVLYIPRYSYPLIPLAKEFGNKVIVHLHDYQPISHNAAVLWNSDKMGSLNAFRDNIRFELFEHASIVRAMLSTLCVPTNRLSRIWICEADRIVCASQRQSQIVKSAAPQLANKLKVIYNPLPKMPIMSKELKDPTLLSLGGDSYIKGFHLFLEASIKILQKGLNTRFLLAGRVKATNRHLTEKLNKNFSGAYKVLGRLRHEEALGLHSISSALLFPSVQEEPLPYAVLEAMLCGTIPIASRVGGIPEIVEDSFAEKMLFDACDVDGCVGRVESLLAMSNEQIEDVAFELREVVMKKFNSEATKKKLMKTFLS